MEHVKKAITCGQFKVGPQLGHASYRQKDGDRRAERKKVGYFKVQFRIFN